MSQLITVQLIVLLALVYLLWLMPTVARPTVPFGVRIPPDQAGAAVIGQQRSRYRLRVLASGGGLVVLAVVALTLTGQPIVLPVSVFAMLALGLFSYYPAHLAIATAKRREGWYVGRRQGMAVDTSLRTDPPRFPWPWAIPALLVLVATSVFGVLRYPELPMRLAVHFASNGQPDRFAAKSVGSVFALVLVQAAITVGIISVTLLILRARPELDIDNPSASARRHRGWVGGMARALLGLLALLNVSMSAMSVVSWQGINPAGWLLAAIVLPGLFGGVVLVVVAVRGRDHTPTVSHGDHEKGDRFVERDDDRYWRGGLIYVNRDDPAVLVPKRFGIGWTLNFGNLRAWLVFGVLIAIAVLSLAWPK